MKFPVLVTRAFKDSTDTVRCIEQAVIKRAGLGVDSE